MLRALNSLFFLPMQTNKQEFGDELKMQADVLFANLNDHIEKIKAQIAAISDNIKSLENKLTSVATESKKE